MYKIVGLFLLSIVVIGCASGNKVKSVGKDSRKKEVRKEDFIRSVLSQNISDSSFFIEKALYSISTKDFEQSGSATIKFNPPGKYLISLKTIAGIELARILITRDSIFINNRIERNYMFGSQAFIKRVYGISTDFLPLIFGDMLLMNSEIDDSIVCNEGYSLLKVNLGTKKLDYRINCNFYKPEETNISVGTVTERKLTIKLGDFISVKAKYVPGSIEINGLDSEFRLTINIKKLNLNWDGAIEFLPGKQYDQIPLL